ncbi:MAG: hypothetical protein H6926_00470 [Chromatiales bacterium]|nr:hypothetical protein [Gammaproteobacteria bacterium]MCP5351653.1 hypothetical protein [Chromatiales bacterium]
MADPRAPTATDTPTFSEAALQDLEAALIKRAENLAARYREQGERGRERLLGDAAEHLNLREQREVLYAKNLADRTYRRRVQSHELRMRKRADILRWDLVREVIDEMRSRATAFAEHDKRYPDLLRGWIRAAIERIDAEAVVVRVNARDRQRLHGDFAALAAAFAPTRQVRLADEPLDTIGGALVSDADDRQRVDDTLEGRAERLHDELVARVLERLFASVPDMDTLFKG